jgi:hypothetical protein
MNVRLKKSYAFNVGIFLNDEFCIQEMTCSLEFYTNTQDSLAQNIAIDRWRHFFDHVIDGAVLVDSSKKDRISALQAQGIRVIDLPDECYDQIVGIAIYLKLNTIAETALIVTDVSIASNQGQYVHYLHNENESTGSLDHDHGWWVENSPNYCNFRDVGGKIVKLKPLETWRDLDLHFDDDEGQSKSETVTKILQFTKNES